MSDPNILLSNMRNAIGSGHPAIAQLSAASLDDHLTRGGALPSDWRHPTWLLIVVTEGDMTEPCVSGHASDDDAVDWLRSGWDVDGRFSHVTDEDELIAAMRDGGVYVTIEQLYRPEVRA